MNTIRSTGYGWGVLMVAGAGAYYFAKKSINEDKAERQEKEVKRRMLLQRMEARERVETRLNTKETSSAVDRIASSGGADGDQTSTDLKASMEPKQRSKYAPSEPYISKKGDRFS